LFFTKSVSIRVIVKGETMYSYGEAGKTMYFLWGDNVFLWERQLIFKYKPDLGLIGHSLVCHEYWFGILFLSLEKQHNHRSGLPPTLY
jgi:hypothetical protein